jgi:hypothetical protein
MNETENFVCKENVALLRRGLETEIDPARRSVVMQLLLAEETKLGSKLEHLGDVEQYIARCQELIFRQEVLVHQMEGNGGDTSQARALLMTLTQTLALHEHRRSQIHKTIDESDH